MSNYHIVKRISNTGKEYYKILYKDHTDTFTVLHWYIYNHRFEFDYAFSDSDNSKYEDAADSLEYAKMVLYNYKLYKIRRNYNQIVYSE